MSGMDVSFNEDGNVLNVWFDHPWKEHHAEPHGRDYVLKKDAQGRVIGVEHHAYFEHGRAPGVARISP